MYRIIGNETLLIPRIKRLSYAESINSSTSRHYRFTWYCLEYRIDGRRAAPEWQSRVDGDEPCDRIEHTLRPEHQFFQRIILYHYLYRGAPTLSRGKPRTAFSFVPRLESRGKFSEERRQELLLSGRILLRVRLGNWPLNEIRERASGKDGDRQAVLITAPPKGTSHYENT